MRQKPYRSRRPNVVERSEQFVLIYCNGDRVVIIDPEVYDKLHGCHFYVNKTTVYVQTSKGAINLSRFVLNIESENRRVLHKNKNSLDCRRENLFSGNVYENCGDYYIGECYDGRTFMIDSEDYDIVSQHVWHIDANGYVITKSQGRIIKQHRLVLGVTNIPDVEVDHIHNDTTDNRKKQLRLVSRSQNCRNRRIMKNNTSGTPGVYWNKSAHKWCAQINIEGKRKYLGSYENKYDAIMARMEANKSHPI